MKIYNGMHEKSMLRAVSPVCGIFFFWCHTGSKFHSTLILSRPTRRPELNFLHPSNFRLYNYCNVNIGHMSQLNFGPLHGNSPVEPINISGISDELHQALLDPDAAQFFDY